MSALSNVVPTRFQPASNPVFAHTLYNPRSVRTLEGMRTPESVGTASFDLEPIGQFLCRDETECHPRNLHTRRAAHG